MKVLTSTHYYPMLLLEVPTEMHLNHLLMNSPRKAPFMSRASAGLRLRIELNTPTGSSSIRVLTGSQVSLWQEQISLFAPQVVLQVQTG